MNLFFKWKMNAQWVKNKRLAGAPSYRKASSVGLLTHHQEGQEATLQRFVSLLEKDHKSISLLSYHQAAPAKSPHAFSEKDLSFWGSLRSPSITRFTHGPHHVLINTSPLFSLYLENIALCTRACLKVGFYDPRRKPYYHLLLKPNATKAPLLQMYDYLTRT